MRLRLKIGSLHLRPVTNDEQSLLEQIYASTRADELVSTGWSPMLQASFVKSQFMAQQLHYRQHFAQGNFQIVERELRDPHGHNENGHLKTGSPADHICVGRLYWCWLPAELRLINIALLPPFQRQGLGSQLVLHLQQLAAAQIFPMSLHVAVTNPAIFLYQRLGFSVCGGDGMHHQMLWRAAPTSSDEK